MKLSDILNAPFLHDAKFFFAAFNALVIFSQRLNFNFNVQEIAAVNLLIAVAFGVAAPTVQYMKVKLYEAQVKAEQVKEMEAASTKEETKPMTARPPQTYLEPAPMPFRASRNTPPPPPAPIGTHEIIP